MLRKGLKEIGILKKEASNSYHLLNPTSIGSLCISLDTSSSSTYVTNIRHENVALVIRFVIFVISFNVYSKIQEIVIDQ